MLFTRFLTELIGTFVFIGTILVTGEALPSALALLTAIYFGGKISGGHFNPAVSTAFFIKGNITGRTWATYVVAQVLGGIMAYAWLCYTAGTRRQLLTATKI